MITAIDTSVLLDVFGADPIHGPGSREALRRCIRDGTLVGCSVVWGEIAGTFPTGQESAEAMRRLQVRYSALEQRAALEAGSVWRRYRERGGRRHQMIPDFLIGAHAIHQADRLLTRDRGYFRDYFEPLVILDPSRF